MNTTSAPSHASHAAAGRAGGPRGAHAAAAPGGATADGAAPTDAFAAMLETLAAADAGVDVDADGAAGMAGALGTGKGTSPTGPDAAAGHSMPGAPLQDGLAAVLPTWMPQAFAHAFAGGAHGAHPGSAGAGTAGPDGDALAEAPTSAGGAGRARVAHGAPGTEAARGKPHEAGKDKPGTPPPGIAVAMDRSTAADAKPGPAAPPPFAAALAAAGATAASGPGTGAQAAADKTATPTPDAAALAAALAPQAGAPASGPAAPVHQAALASHPLDAAFAGDLSAQVNLMLDQGTQQAELSLNPADLGPIRIELTLNSQVADISFSAAHASTREGIAQALPALREMLASQGLSLGQAGVGQHAQAQQRDAQQEAPRRAGRGGPGAAGAVGGPGATPATRSAAVRGGSGLLDLYA